jgi:hypothetical protein
MANPIFIAARLNELSAVMVRENVEETFIGQIPVNTLCPIEDYHTTLLYDKLGIKNNLIPYADILMETPNLKAVGFEYRYFNNGILALVLISPALRELNKLFYRNALSRSTFASYVPHITVAKDIETKIPYTPSFINLNVPIMYDYIYSEPIKG